MGCGSSDTQPTVVPSNSELNRSKAAGNPSNTSKKDAKNNKGNVQQSRRQKTRGDKSEGKDLRGSQSGLRNSSLGDSPRSLGKAGVSPSKVKLNVEDVIYEK